MFKDLNPPKPITKPQDSPDWNAPKVGLGDRIEKLAQPIARVIDKHSRMRSLPEKERIPKQQIYLKIN